MRDWSSPFWQMSITAEEEFEAQYFARPNKGSKRISNKKKDRRKRTAGQYSYGPRGRSSKQRVPQQRMRQEKRQVERQARAESLVDIYSPCWRRQQRLSSSQSCSTRARTGSLETTNKIVPYRQHRSNNDEQTAAAMAASLGIPSAQELGLNTAMYGRLLQIASGADIAPEDYDLLLLLDEKNTRTTMQDISELEILVVGNTDEDKKDNKSDCGKVNNDDGTNETAKQGEEESSLVPGSATSRISPQSLGESSCCLICLQNFRDLEEGTRLCRLPCQHVFCHSCIEVWLRERSAKCPDLSCFWQATTGTDNRDVGGSD